MEVIYFAASFAATTLLAKISWDLFCIREALENNHGADFVRQIKEEHPCNVADSPFGDADHELRRWPRAKVTQPIPKVGEAGGKGEPPLP